MRRVESGQSPEGPKEGNPIEQIPSKGGVLGSSMRLFLNFLWTSRDESLETREAIFISRQEKKERVQALLQKVTEGIKREDLPFHQSAITRVLEQLSPEELKALEQPDQIARLRTLFIQDLRGAASVIRERVR